MIKYDSQLLNAFFMEELKALINKYNSIPEAKVGEIENLISVLKGNKVNIAEFIRNIDTIVDEIEGFADLIKYAKYNEKLIKSVFSSLEFAKLISSKGVGIKEICPDDSEMALMILNYSINNKINYSIEKIEDIINKLEYKKYFIDEDNGVAFYLNDSSSLDDFAKSYLDNAFQDSCYIENNFDKEALIDYIMDGKGIEEMYNDTIDNVDSSEIIGLTGECELGCVDDEVIYVGDYNNMY